ncbi:MAG: hypothetical protein ACK443_09150 [Methylococcaceae bacterium]|jgi:hypothetical protein
MNKKEFIKNTTSSGGSNISPIHLHGSAFIPEKSLDKWKLFIGRNTILKDHDGKAIKGIQASFVDEVYNHDGWFRYSNKQALELTGNWCLSCMNSNYDWAYPSSFVQNPELFLSY